MNIKRRIKSSFNKNRMILSALAIFFSIMFFSCENALVEAAKAIQAEAVSPSISVSKSNTPIGAGESITFDQISVGSRNMSR